jgi:1,4-dihydroxy-2-naphthoyl-CoA hydrolase
MSHVSIIHISDFFSLEIAFSKSFVIIKSSNSHKRYPMNLLDYLGIQTEETKADYVRLSLTITEQHKQPFGILHGGINAVLIETACSLGANQAVDTQHFAAAIDLQVNHLKAVLQGTVIVEATPDRIGGKIQTWQATIRQADGTKTAVGRCTLTAVKK